MSFGVLDEWGRLREAIVGRSLALAELLQREGVTVHRVDAASARDPLIVIGPHLVEASLRSESRQSERYALRPFAQQMAMARRGARWSSVPPGWPNGVDGPFLEGGDVLLNGHEIYVGMSGRASDMAGIDWLESQLGRDHKVVPVALRSSVQHLEDVLALVRPGLLVHCPELLVDGLPMALHGWEAIAIAPEDARQWTAHLLMLDPGRAVIDTGNVRIGNELRARGIEVMALPFAEGLRAAHLALWRESERE